MLELLKEHNTIPLEDITPEFVAPVVALVQNNKIYNPIRSEILKAYETIYTKNIMHVSSHTIFDGTSYHAKYVLL